jgi:hypothetical protein
MGETLLARYCEADQEPGAAERNREHQRRQRLWQTYAQAGAGKLSRAQAQECRWSPEGLRVRLRLEAAGLDCDLHDALALSNLREGDRLILSPRWVTDQRLPADQRKEYTPTPKQLLYGQRCELRRIVATERDASNRVVAGYVEVALVESFGGEWSRGFVFPGIPQPLEEGRLYTLDPCPNDWYGYWSLQVVEGLRRGEGNTLYELLADPSRLDHDPRPPRARPASWPAFTPSRRPGSCTTSRGPSGSTSATTAGCPCCWCRGRRARARATEPPSPSSPVSRGRCRPTGTSGPS